MALIKIIASGEEIDVVKETLTIRKDNNAFIRDFTVSRNTNPFLVVENEKTKRLLGTRDITSVNKIKIIVVQVTESGQNYYGELQVLSYINGFRKCNLRYATELLSIMGKKIASFMPVISVVEDETPVPFTEESPALVDGYDQWQAFAADIIDKCYPETMVQVPQMTYKKFFGEDLEEDDPWATYQNHFNNFSGESEDLSYVENLWENVDENNVSVTNRNVAAPQVFLLAPLFYALQSIGFRPSGDLPASEFWKRVLMLSTKTNISEVVLHPTNTTDVVFDGEWFDAGLVFPFATRRRGETFTVSEATTYTVYYRFVLPLQPDSTDPVITSFRARVIAEFGITADAVVAFNATMNADNEVFEGEFDITVGSTSWDLEFYYYNRTELMPIEYEIYFRKAGSDRTFGMMHPTIETGRFVPEWTFGEYLNNLKNHLNLDITADDFTKKLILNFNEESILSTEKVILDKSFAITGYDQTPSTAFLLKFDNDEDAALWITTDGEVPYVDQISDFSETLDSKFKFVPNNNFTAELSEALEDKDGVGLMIYDPARRPVISKSFEDKTLAMEGDNGIYATCWRKWLKFRLNASLLEISGPLSEVQASKIASIKRVYIDHQDYFVSNIEYSETEQGTFKAKMNLLSVNI